MSARDDRGRLDTDLHTEVRALTSQFRAALEHRARSGTLGVSLGAMPRVTVAAPASPAPGPVMAALQAPPADAGSDGPYVDPSAFDSGCVGGSSGASGLQVVRDELGDCQRCRLSEGRRNLVFGVGNPHAELVFVGEAPGRDEDEQGEPFVGKAGQLLTRMIEAMGFRREDVYICNVIKCRPPQNRNPEPDEVSSCEPFLKKQLAALRPRVIVALGKFAAQCLCGEDTPITRLRGNFRSYQGIQVMPTFHPAYLLRNPDGKRAAWADLKAVLEVLERLGIRPPAPPRT